MAFNSVHLLTGRIAAFLPPLALPDPKSCQTSLEGVVLKVETIGFAALVESLVKTGREGADVLMRVLNSYFSPAIKLVAEHGGQVIDLDANGMLAFFPHSEEAANVATAISLRIMQLTGSFSTVQTNDGRYDFQARAGLATGQVQALNLGSTVSEQALLFSGVAVEEAIKLCSEAKWGEVAAGTMQADVIDLPDEVVSSGTSSLYELFGKEDPISVYNRLSSYLPRVIAQRIKAAPDGAIAGEFRRAVNIFVQLNGIDLGDQEQAAALQHYYLKVQQACNGLDGRINQIAPSGEKGVRLHLTFGAVLSNSDDAEHALRAAIAVRGLSTPSGEIASVGIASGSVYTGIIGTSECQAFVVLGEVVNVACNFAQTATKLGQGTILVDRYTRERVGLAFLYGEELSLAIEGRAKATHASRLLATRPVGIDLKTFVKDFGPTAQAQAAEVDETKLMIADSNEQAVGIAQSWLQAGNEGACSACVPHTANVPYLVWSGLLNGLIGLQETDSRTEKTAKVSQAMTTYAHNFPSQGIWVSRLVGLMPEDANFRQQLADKHSDQLANMMSALLKGIAQAKPLLVVLRDVQYADEPSLSLLEKVVRELREAAVAVSFCVSVARGADEVRSRLAALA